MRSMRWKLLVTTLVVVYIPVYLLNRYTLTVFDRFTSRMQEETMLGYARILGEQVRLATAGGAASAPAAPVPEAPAPPAPPPGLAALLRAAADRVQARFSYASSDGTLLADSAPEAALGIDLSALPEIASARQGRHAARWSVTDDRRYVYYFVAHPVLREGRVIGIVHVTQHTSHIIQTILQIKRDQRLMMLAALVGALALSALVAQTMTRRLRRLTQAVRRHAAGQAPLDVAFRGRDEIAELGGALTELTLELEKRNRYNRDFLSRVMHELRIPITAIAGATEVLGDRAEAADPAQREKFLRNITIEADRMRRMVEGLNELTSLETDSARSLPDVLDYVACVRGIVERLQPAFAEPHVRIEVRLPAEPLYVHGLPGRLEQVFANLLENALRYTPPAGAVSVTVVPHGPRVLTTVSDTGCGIPPALLERICEPLFTTEPSDRPKTYGRGLGLAIVKSIVEMHSGKLRIASTPGCGASFAFELPLVATPRNRGGA